MERFYHPANRTIKLQRRRVSEWPMKRSLKIILFLLLTSMIPLGLCSCWDKVELDDLAIVLGVGIDKAESPDDINLTIQIEKSSGTDTSSSSYGSSDGENSKFINLTESGTNVSTTMDEFAHMISREIYLAHNQLIVFGNDLAKEGIRDQMDYFLRNYQGRLNVNICVAKGRAEDIFEVSSDLDQIPSVKVSDLIENQNAALAVVDLNVADLMMALSSSSKSMVAPYLEIVNEEGQEHLSISDCAVFKGDKVVGELDPTETRGYLWVQNKVTNGKYIVNVLDEQVTLSTVKVESKVNPVINKEGCVSVKITVKEQCIMESQTGSVDLNTQDHIELLQKAAAKVIKGEIQQTLDKSMQLGTDIYGFGDMLKQKYPHKWKAIEESWDDLYQNIDVQVDVTAEVRGEGRLINPDYPKES